MPFIQTMIALASASLGLARGAGLRTSAIKATLAMLGLGEQRSPASTATPCSRPLIAVIVLVWLGKLAIADRRGDAAFEREAEG